MKTPTHLEWLTEGHLRRHSWCYTWGWLAICALIMVILVTAPTWGEWIDSTVVEQCK